MHVITSVALASALLRVYRAGCALFAHPALFSRLSRIESTSPCDPVERFRAGDSPPAFYGAVQSLSGRSWAVAVGSRSPISHSSLIVIVRALLTVRIVRPMTFGNCTCVRKIVV